MTSWDEPTKVRVRASMQGVYALFLARLAEGRGLPQSVIEPSAEGRVFSGEDAKRRQLVDEIGGLEEAIARARALAKLPPDAEADVVGESENPIGELLGVQAGSPGFPASFSGGYPVGNAVPFVSALQTALEPLSPWLALAQGEHVVLAAPYAVVIR
jgi:ClpP class serine protease